MTSPSTPCAPSARSTRFTREGVRRGFIAAQPLAIGVGIYGVTFGLLALGSGLTVLEAMLMSASVYSASAQVAAVGALAQGAGLLLCVTTVVLLNARYLLYGATLRPWLGGAPASAAYGSLYLLGDGNWLLSMQAHQAGEDDAGFILGSGLATFLPWLAGTLIGGWVGHGIPGPRALGLDFLLVAFCAAMLVGMLRRHASRGPLLAAAVAALVADRWAPPGWAVVAAGVAGAMVAGVQHRNAAAPDAAP
ncbi:MAG: AzlC family ABC transporter permease [Burkholderiaceae bacterium]